MNVVNVIVVVSVMLVFVSESVSWLLRLVR